MKDERLPRISHLWLCSSLSKEKSPKIRRSINHWRNGRRKIKYLLIEFDLIFRQKKKKLSTRKSQWIVLLIRREWTHSPTNKVSFLRRETNNQRKSLPPYTRIFFSRFLQWQLTSSYWEKNKKKKILFFWSNS